MNAYELGNGRATKHDARAHHLYTLNTSLGWGQTGRWIWHVMLLNQWRPRAKSVSARHTARDAAAELANPKDLGRA